MHANGHTNESSKSPSTTEYVCVCVCERERERVCVILRRNLAPEKDVAESTISAFLFSMLSFLFLIYPVVSSTVLQTFNCIDLEGYGNYLKVDMRVECPKDTQDAGFAWSTVFVFIYPIG